LTLVSVSLVVELLEAAAACCLLEGSPPLAYPSAEKSAGRRAFTNSLFFSLLKLFHYFSPLQS